MKYLAKQTLAVIALIFALAAPLQASPVKLDIYGPGQRILNLAMADPLGKTSSTSNELNALITENLTFLPFIRTIPPAGIMGGARLNGFKSPDVDFNRFKMAGADLLVTT